MEVEDYHNDIILAEVCRADVEKHCRRVEPGGCAHRPLGAVDRDSRLRLVPAALIATCVGRPG